LGGNLAEQRRKYRIPPKNRDPISKFRSSGFSIRFKVLWPVAGANKESRDLTEKLTKQRWQKILT